MIERSPLATPPLSSFKDRGGEVMVTFGPLTHPKEGLVCMENRIDFI